MFFSTEVVNITKEICLNYLITIPSPPMKNTIAKAIKNSSELSLIANLPFTSKSKPFRFQPYILGVDVLGFPFVWGYLPDFQCFYKVTLDMIVEIEIIGISYSAFNNAKYIRPGKEKHTNILKGQWKYVP